MIPDTLSSEQLFQACPACRSYLVSPTEFSIEGIDCRLTSLTIQAVFACPCGAMWMWMLELGRFGRIELSRRA